MHTTGINWESVAVIVGGVSTAFAAVLTLLFWVFSRRDRRREREVEERESARADERQEVRELIAAAMDKQTDALNHQTEVLMAKLETKATVAEISIRLARVEGKYGIASTASN